MAVAGMNEPEGFCQALGSGRFCPGSGRWIKPLPIFAGWRGCRRSGASGGTLASGEENGNLKLTKENFGKN